MPAPPVCVTAMRESDDETVWVGFQLAVSLSALAAVFRADSLEATVLSADCMPLTEYWRFWIRVVPWRSRAISWSTIELVSTPDARPERAREPEVVVATLDRRSRHDLERGRRRDRADHVAGEVADLDDHAPGLLVLVEVELAVVGAQLGRAGGG